MFMTSDDQHGTQTSHREEVNSNSPPGSQQGSASAVPAPKVICRTLPDARSIV